MEALPSWDYTKYVAMFKEINASRAILLVKAYDLYGNIAESEISVTFREVQRITTAQTTTIAVTTAQPPIYTTTQPAIIVATTTPVTAITSITSPTTPVETSGSATPLTATYAQRAIGDSLGLIVGIVIAVVGIALVVILFIKRRG